MFPFDDVIMFFTEKYMTWTTWKLTASGFITARITHRGLVLFCLHPLGLYEKLSDLHLNMRYWENVTVFLQWEYATQGQDEIICFIDQYNMCIGSGNVPPVFADNSIRLYTFRKFAHQSPAFNGRRTLGMSNLIIFYNLQNIWLSLLIDLDILTII